MEKISLQKEIKVFTRLFLRREQFSLYGFLSPRELEIFDILESISGIGPKTALLLSSFGSLQELKKAIEKGKIPKGISKKKLQRVLLELTGKIKEISEKETEKEKTEREILETLKSLGFSLFEAKEALSKIPPHFKEPEERLKEALKILGKR